MAGQAPPNLSLAAADIAVRDRERSPRASLLKHCSSPRPKAALLAPKASSSSRKKGLTRLAGQDTLAAQPRVGTVAIESGMAIHARLAALCFPADPGVAGKQEEATEENGNAPFHQTNPVAPEGGHGALGQSSPRLTRRSAPSMLPAQAAAPLPRLGGKPALTRSSCGHRARAHTPRAPRDPRRDLETSSANLGKQLFLGSQPPERKGAELGRGKTKESRRKATSPGGLGDGPGPPRRGSTKALQRLLREGEIRGSPGSPGSDPGP